LIRLATQEGAELNVAEALAVLLQTWNQAFYRYRGGFKAADLENIESLLDRSSTRLGVYFGRDILSLADEDENGIEKLFNSFEAVLGPVGAAKALHLLVPTLFPLWDRRIARRYSCSLKTGANGPNHLKFMQICQAQLRQLADQGTPCTLKSLDEFNYRKFTKGWVWTPISPATFAHHRFVLRGDVIKSSSSLSGRCGPETWTPPRWIRPRPAAAWECA
jgi:hypothetical protein